MTARAARPQKGAVPLTEAELDRILPQIDETDPEWQAYVRRKIREALDDPRPDIPAEEAFAEIYAHIERRRAARKGGD
jgi:antitoxin ParD1/3/4